MTSPAAGSLTKEQSTLIFRPESFFQRLDLEKLYFVHQPIEVELGSGDGSFLAQYAASVPERNFLGVERLLGRLRKLDKKGQRAGLKNLRLLRVEAAYFLEYMLQPESIAALHIYFPDPWPKRRHLKNRLINERFTDLSRQVLKPNGIVYLRTDDVNYFTQMVTVYDANPNFRKIETPESLSRIVTDFERGFNAKGIPTQRAAYQRQS